MTAPSWPDLPAEHPFGPQTLPYGIATLPSGETRVVVRLGEQALDCAGLAAAQPGGESDALDLNLVAALGQPTLNALLDLGPRWWARLREWLTEAVTRPERREAVAAHLVALDQVTMHLPFAVADYVDFYASEYHAMNVGQIFRPDSPALPPNWKHLPIGYHGRSGTVIVSGTDVVRPTGQRKGPNDPAPVYGPSVRLDIEAELGFVVGGATAVGTRVSVADAADHLFGVVILNDWSARDIQAWEYVPLGPFLGKSFATSISAWVTPMAALREARVAVPGQQDPTPLPYLTDGPVEGLAIHVEVEWNGTTVSRPEFAAMYWSPEQMVAHMTVNGASLRSGDLFGSGTISGPEKATRGSFLELSWNGTEPVTLADGSTRGFLEDGDTVTLRAWAPGPDGSRIGLGEVTGTIAPAV